MTSAAADNGMLARGAIQVVRSWKTLFQQLVLIPVGRGLDPVPSRRDCRFLPNEVREFGNAARARHWHKKAVQACLSQVVVVIEKRRKERKLGSIEHARLCVNQLVEPIRVRGHVRNTTIV